jgi:small-conductance mechanosensitive channel
LEQKNVDVNEELRKKLAEIEQMHKEVEEKSVEVAEKAKQIDTLLMQLNESTRYLGFGLNYSLLVQ